MPSDASTARCIVGSLLIADDDEMFRDSTAELLSQAGYACAVAADATALGAKLREQEFDLIIADIVMPGNANLEMVADLARQVEAPPVLLVTGYPTIETAAKAVRCRAVGYLTKPVDLPVLLENVRREVDSQQARRLIHKRRGKLELVLRDLRDLESNLCHARRGSSHETLNIYLTILAEHVHTAVQDLRALVEVIVAREGDEGTRRRLEGTRPYVLLDTLREAVAVLEQTKRSFKSKELADLRAKLEALVVQAGTPPRGLS